MVVFAIKKIKRKKNKRRLLRSRDLENEKLKTTHELRKYRTVHDNENAVHSSVSNLFIFPVLKQAVHTADCL